MTENHLSKPSDRLAGIFYMTAASLGFALMALCVKAATARLPAFEVVFFRSLIGTLMMTALMLKKRTPFWGTEKGPLILRGVSGFVAVAFHFLTIAKLPLGLAVMLNYTAPIFAALLAAAFLGERPGRFLWSMIFVSFIGVYLLTAINSNGSVGKEDAVYIALGLFSGFAAAVAYSTIRSLHHRESPFTIIFYFTFLSTIGSTFLLFLGFEWPTAWEWLALAGVAIGSFFGQIWMTVAFRRAPASLVSPFSYLTPVFSFFFGAVFWNDPVTLYTLAGAALIVIAGASISLKEAIYD